MNNDDLNQKLQPSAETDSVTDNRNRVDTSFAVPSPTTAAATSTHGVWSPIRTTSIGHFNTRHDRTLLDDEALGERKPSAMTERSNVAGVIGTVGAAAHSITEPTPLPAGSSQPHAMSMTNPKEPPTLRETSDAQKNRQKPKQEKQQHQSRRTRRNASGNINASYVSSVLPEGEKPLQLDVICGRDKVCHHHVGNRRFRVVIGMNHERYKTAPSRTHRKRITTEIIEHVHNWKPGGRFLKLDTTTGRWCVATNDYTRDKVSHALRSAKDPNGPKASKNRKPNKAEMEHALLSNAAHKAYRHISSHQLFIHGGSVVQEGQSSCENSSGHSSNSSIDSGQSDSEKKPAPQRTKRPGGMNHDRNTSNNSNANTNKGIVDDANGTGHTNDEEEDEEDDYDFDHLFDDDDKDNNDNDTNNGFEFDAFQWGK